MCTINAVSYTHLLNATVGMVNVLVDEDVWAEREVEELSDIKRHNNSHGFGRELFLSLIHI